MAFNGIAAVNIDGGTLCSLLSIPIPNGNDDRARLPPLSTSKRNEISRALLIDQLSLIIIDEISNVNATMMHAISKRLQQLTENHDEPFGGLGVLCFGDFSQLPPVKSTSITHTLMMTSELDQKTRVTRTQAATNSLPSSNRTSFVQTHQSNNNNRKRNLTDIRKETNNKRKAKTLAAHGKYRSTSAPRQGADIFATFTRIHLNEQHRTKDKKHLNFLKSMSEGKQITTDDIKQYKKFDHSDATNDSEWKFAPVRVANNRERIDIVHHKTLLFAQHHHTYAFRWQTDVARWQNKPTLPNERDDLQNRDPSFWQHFVPGASGFLTTNLNTNLGLANGTPIILHSLTFASDEQLQHVRSQIRSLTL